MDFNKTRTQYNPQFIQDTLASHNAGTMRQTEESNYSEIDDNETIFQFDEPHFSGQSCLVDEDKIIMYSVTEQPVSVVDLYDDIITANEHRSFSDALYSRTTPLNIAAVETKGNVLEYVKKWLCVNRIAFNIPSVQPLVRSIKPSLLDPNAVKPATNETIQPRKITPNQELMAKCVKLSEDRENCYVYDNVHKKRCYPETPTIRIFPGFFTR